MKVFNCFTFECSTYGYNTKTFDSGIHERGINEKVENVKEYESADYMELGAKLGESMFYFVKFQKFVEQFEKNQKSSCVKAMANNLNRSIVRKEVKRESGKMQENKFIIKTTLANSQKFSNFESIQGKEILQDIIEEYKSNCEDREDASDDSYDEDIIDEEQLLSLISVNYKLVPQKPVINHEVISEFPNDKTSCNVSVRPLSHEKNYVRKTREHIPFPNRSTVYEPKESINSSFISKNTCNRKEKAKCDSYYYNNIPAERKTHKNILSGTSVYTKKIERNTTFEKPTTDNLDVHLPLFQSIKWKAMIRRYIVQNKNQRHFGDRYYLENFDELKRSDRFNNNPATLSIQSQKVQFFNRMNSNIYRRNVVNTQIKTKTGIKSIGHK